MNARLTEGIETGLSLHEMNNLPTIAAMSTGFMRLLQLPPMPLAAKVTIGADNHPAGIPVWVDSKPHIAHKKVVIVDHTTVIGGSFNLTSNADHWDSENLAVIRDPQWAAAYEQNFENRLAASETLTNYQAAHQK